MASEDGSREADSLFKSACERCSRSKIKCSGGTPCSSCEKKSLECVYAFKRKRGPKPGAPRSSSQVKKSKPNYMSSYEKRVWSVFFTIFKNLKRSAKENVYSWNWFVVQLCRLDSYVSKADSVKGTKMREVLDSFYKTMDLDGENLCSAIKTSGCPIPPHLCMVCSTKVFGGEQSGGAPPEKGTNGHHHNCPSIPGSISPPQDVNIINSKRRNWQLWKSTSFDVHYENNDNACLVYESTAESFGVFVNNKFKETFGYDDTAMNKLLMWSGGGFLPWGGDILAALLVNESDLLVYLKVMATKYQALGTQEVENFQLQFRGEGDFEESLVPSLNSFPVWANQNKSGSSSLPCEDLKCVVERLKPIQVQFSTTIRIKRRKNACHNVFLRFELMCLDDLVGYSSMNSPTPLPASRQLQKRVTHTEPFVNARLYEERVAQTMNRSLWSNRFADVGSGFTVDRVIPQEHVTQKEEENFNGPPELTPNEAELDNLLISMPSFDFGVDNMPTWDLPDFTESIEPQRMDTYTSGSGSGRTGEFSRSSSIDFGDTAFQKEDDMGLDADTQWLQELTGWAEK